MGACSSSKQDEPLSQRQRRSAARAALRGITVSQLRGVERLMQERCEAEGWVSTKDWATPLKSSTVTLYDLTFHVIEPATVPNGVVMTGLRPRAFKPGAAVLQPSSRAAGTVAEEAEGAQGVRVRVQKGRFRAGEPLEVDGAASKGPKGFLWTDGITHCSYVETLTQKEQPPQFFVTHWWGEAVQHFVASVADHAEVRRLGPNAAYWICGYAIDQHELEETLCGSESPKAAGFSVALRMSTGILVILDDECEVSGPATPFERIWCGFEKYLAKEAEDEGKKFLFDIAAVSGGAATTLADGIPAGDKIHKVLHEEGKHGFVGDPIPSYKSRLQAQNKSEREGPFPAGVLKKGMELKIERASASVAADRARILNCIAEREGAQEPLDAHPNYERVNCHIRARFAVAAWRRLAEEGLVEEWGLPGILRAGKTMAQVTLDFTDLPGMDNAAIKSLASGLPDHLRNLQLGLVNCPIDDEGVAALARSLSEKTGLAEMRLTMNNLQLSDAGVGALASGLPRSLCCLTLNFTGTGITDAGMGSLAKGLPALETLYLDFDLCDKYTDDGVRALAAALPAGLRSLTLYFNSNPAVTDDAVSALAAKLPESLTSVDVCFCRCPNVTDGGLARLADAVPQDVKELTLDFSSTQVGDAGLENLAGRSLPQLKTLCLWLNYLAITDAGLERLRAFVPGSAEDVEMRFVGGRVTEEACAHAAEALRARSPPPKVAVLCKLG
mmetsp:Transcript_76024/g.201913  ORF Transcript_76024/g.201913 Transcript_76024/m.201913 type:complete len:727 (-) Transcript_76024:37-2217(-)